MLEEKTISERITELKHELHLIEHRDRIQEDEVRSPCGGIVIRSSKNSVSVLGAKVLATPSQVEILKHLCKEWGETVNFERLYRSIRNPRRDFGTYEDQLVKVHISNIRRKFLKGTPFYIQNVWSKGYFIDKR